MVTQPVIGRRTYRLAIGTWLSAPQPRSLCLVGSAGIGKTTLWQHAIDAAAEHGRAVVAWRAASAEQHLLFAGMAGLLDSVDLTAAMSGLSGPRRTALTAALGLTVRLALQAPPHARGRRWHGRLISRC